jgi:hypothetical protein
MQIQFQCEEAERNWAHQLEMLKAHIELVKLHRGAVSNKLDSLLLDGMEPMLPMPEDYQTNDLHFLVSS